MANSTHGKNRTPNHWDKKCLTCGHRKGNHTMVYGKGLTGLKEIGHCCVHPGAAKGNDTGVCDCKGYSDGKMWFKGERRANRVDTLIERMKATSAQVKELPKPVPMGMTFTPSELLQPTEEWQELAGKAMHQHNCKSSVSLHPVVGGQRQCAVRPAGVVCEWFEQSGVYTFCRVCLLSKQSNLEEWQELADKTMRQHKGEELAAFEGGATRSKMDFRFDLMPREAIDALARRLALGAAKHGENNWKEGGEEFIKATKNHLYNHLLDYLANGNENDENTDAIICNAAFLCYFESRKCKKT